MGSGFVFYSLDYMWIFLDIGIELIWEIEVVVYICLVVDMGVLFVFWVFDFCVVFFFVVLVDYYFIKKFKK